MEIISCLFFNGCTPSGGLKCSQLQDTVYSSDMKWTPTIGWLKIKPDPRKRVVDKSRTSQRQIQLGLGLLDYLFFKSAQFHLNIHEDCGSERK